MKKFVCREDYPVVQTEAGKLRGYEWDGSVILNESNTRMRSVLCVRKRYSPGRESRTPIPMEWSAR